MKPGPTFDLSNFGPITPINVFELVQTHDIVDLITMESNTRGQSRFEASKSRYARKSSTIGSANQ